MNINNLKITAEEIRIDVIEMISNAGSGHTAGSLDLADIFTYLYFEELKINPKNPTSKTRDFLFLSNGHTAPILYATLAKRGFFKRELLKSLRKLGSPLQGHPHYATLGGVENSGGPLGQGISQAVGLASVLKRENKRNRVYCIMGDGELAEGECWEAFMYASKEKLDNLVVIIDNNNIQIDGFVDDVSHFENLHKKLSSFGFFVIEFNGNDMNQIKSAFYHAKTVKNKPICLLAKTTAGCGVSFIENDYNWHGKAPSKDERERAVDEIKMRIEELKRGV